MNEASRAQINAAAPATSVWLSANAGSGKTRVLTDRVARLLLQGVGPERILCLTYTKAAAMEMQNRLFKRLGEWAMMPDTKLRAALQEIGEDAIDPDRLGRAHAFCPRDRGTGRPQDPDHPFLLRHGAAPLPARGGRQPRLHRD